VDKSTHWGDLESEEEESSDEEEEENDEAVEVDTASIVDGLSSVVSGYSSLPSGLETPEALNLRKGGQHPPPPPHPPTHHHHHTPTPTPSPVLSHLVSTPAGPSAWRPRRHSTYAREVSNHTPPPLSQHSNCYPATNPLSGPKTLLHPTFTNGVNVQRLNLPGRDPVDCERFKP